MEPQNTQGKKTDIHPDQAAASLAFATHLTDGMMPKNGSATPQEGQGQQQTPQSPQDPQKEMEDLKTEFTDGIKGLRKEMKDEIKKQIEGIRQDIQQAING